MSLSPSTLKTIAIRVVVAFVGAFLAALPTTVAAWNVAIAEKAAYAGGLAVVVLIQSVVTALITGAPQVTPAGRVAGRG